MKKTLLVGLDAACWEYLEPLLETNRLPTLRRLMDAGTWGIMRSTMPAYTPTAWSSIITGKNPGKHGVFDMLWRRPGTYDFVPTSARMRIGTPFWRRLNDAGHRVGLVNIPFTHPPDPIDGFVVGGFGTPSSAADVTYPHELLQWVEERFGPYEPAVSNEILLNGEPSEILVAETKHQKRQIEIAAELAHRHRIEVLAINLMLLDHANHKIPDMERVQQAIVQCDADLAYLIARFTPDNVMLISDHGSRRVKGEFLLHVWLRDRGYFSQVERTGTDRSAALNWVLMQRFQAGHQRTGTAEKLLRRLIRTQLAWTPQRFAKPLWKLIADGVPFAQEHVRFGEETDYERTRLLLGSVFSGLLYLNLAGREPRGVVLSEERAAFSAALAEELLQIGDPDTSMPLISRVASPAQLYHGPATQYAPDLILDSYDAAWNVVATCRTGAQAKRRVRDRYFVDNQRDFGVHSRDGIFVFCGQNFTTSGRNRDSRLMDVAPTLLQLYDVPIPQDYDGRVLSDTMDPEFVATHPVRLQAGDAESFVPSDDLPVGVEAEELIGRLRALGYVD